LTYNGGAIATGNGNFTASNNLTLGGDTSVSVGSGTALFSGTITGGGNSLSVNGSSIGTFTMTGAVSGLSTLLSDIGTIVQGSTLSATGAITMKGSSGISLGGNVTTTTSGNVMITGPVTLTAAVTVDTSAGNNLISFEGATTSIDGAFAFAATSGAAGTGNLRFDGAIGSNVALTSFTTTTGASAVTLMAQGVTTSGAQTYGSGTGGNLSLVGDCNFVSTGSNLAFKVINGNYNAFFSADGGAGTVTFAGAVGTITPLKSVDVEGISQIGASIKTRS
jgi:hypothetical protein